MTFTGALTILGFALMPYLWLLVALLIALVGVQTLARLRGYLLRQFAKGSSLALAVVVGLSGLLWIPAFTHSRLAYVASAFDWIAMLGALLGLAVLAFVLLHPALYLLSGSSAQRQP